ncbi:uncharacterized protein LOC107293712 [Protobothrops mucrosquamatus]|uniref:uncharacterized protein LOC107293712 n=1 Tax=Protobothrops mucrosquamatus TaxID=103944 RepID=UPI000775C9D5|nr:uncharacterized protein LOC107293712 [Protobothrops mucrosquamatus]
MGSHYHGLMDLEHHSSRSNAGVLVQSTGSLPDLSHPHEQEQGSPHVPVSDSRRDGCPPQSLAQRTALCFSSLATPPRDDLQDPARTSGDPPDCTTLAEMSVVRRPGRALRLPSMEDSSRSYCSHSGGTSAPGPTVSPTNRLALERRALTRDAYSLRVIAMIQQSRRPSTNRIYDATWRSFCIWCSGRKVELSDISVPIVLEFLMDGLDKGLSPSTIHRQVTALSTVLMCDNSAPLAPHPTVRSFLKGAANARPPTVHRYPSWDLHRVLQALISPPFKPITTCSLKLLSMKVAFLVAITSARRISELAGLSVREDLCIFHADRVCRPIVGFVFSHTESPWDLASNQLFSAETEA